MTWSRSAPSSGLQMTLKWGEWAWGPGRHLEGQKWAGGMGQNELYKIQGGHVQSPTPQDELLATAQAGKQLCWKGAGGLERAQAGCHGRKGGWQHPGLYQQDHSQLMMEGINSLYSALLRHHIEQWVHCWGHQKKDFNELSMRTFKMQNRLPREVVVSILQGLQLNEALIWSHIWPWPPVSRRLDYRSPEGPSSLMCSMILQFCKLLFGRIISFNGPKKNYAPFPPSPPPKDSLIDQLISGFSRIN